MPAPPKTIDRATKKPQFAQSSEALTALTLPDFGKASFAIAVEPVGSPSFQGLSLAAAAEALAPILGSTGTVNKAAWRRAIYTRLGWKLLKRGVTRFIDLAWLRPVGASSTPTSSKELGLTAGLDQLALLGRLNRVRYVLLFNEISTERRAEAIPHVREVVPEALESYRRQQLDYESSRKRLIDSTKQARNEYQKTFTRAVDQYQKKFAKRNTWEQIGDWFLGHSDRARTETRGQAVFEKRAEKLMSTVPRAALSASEVTQMQEGEIPGAEVMVHKTVIEATLHNTTSGQTLWAYQASFEAGTEEESIGGALDTLVEALLENTRTRAGRLASSRTTAEPLPITVASHPPAAAQKPSGREARQQEKERRRLERQQARQARKSEEAQRKQHRRDEREKRRLERRSSKDGDDGAQESRADRKQRREERRLRRELRKKRAEGSD